MKTVLHGYVVFLQRKQAKISKTQRVLIFKVSPVGGNNKVKSFPVLSYREFFSKRGGGTPPPCITNRWMTLQEWVLVQVSKSVKRKHSCLITTTNITVKAVQLYVIVFYLSIFFLFLLFFGVGKGGGVAVQGRDGGAGGGRGVAEIQAITSYDNSFAYFICFWGVDGT